MSAHHTAIAELVVKGRLHGQETNNVMHFGFTGLEPQYAALALAVINCIFTALRPAITEDWTLEMVTVRELWPVKRDPVEVQPQQATAGTGLPGGVSFSSYLIRKRTGLGGRTNRGRIYVAGTIENDVNASRLTDAGLARLQVYVQCLIDTFIPTPGNPKTWELGVLSRKELKAAGATAQTSFTECSNLIAIREVKSMRSRQIGHGG